MPETTVRSVDPSEFSAPTSRPTLSPETYAARLGRLESTAAAEGYDAFVVYGDREHAANLTCLTGYDPRFEGGLLVVDCGGDDRPTLLVGNEGSTERLASGAPLPMDVIPANDRPHWVSNVEDGVVLADEALRERFADAYPGAWERIRARREFVADVLDIDPVPSVLPFSNLPAYLPPFLLSSDRVPVHE